MVHFWDSVKEGVTLVNRNWQLVLIRVVASLITFIGFFIIVGIPFAIAVIAVGVNLLAARPEAFLEGLKDILLKGYLGIALLLVMGILIYLIFAVTLWVYVLAGSFGVLGANLKNPAHAFKLSGFFSEGKRLFWPFTRFYTIIGLFVILVFLLLGLAGGVAVVALGLPRESLPLVALYLVGVFSIIMFLAFEFSVFGAGIIVLESRGAWESVKGGWICRRIRKEILKWCAAWEAVKKGWSFLAAHPRAFWGYGLLLFSYFFVSLFLLVLAYPFSLIPIIGSLIMLPYQIMVSAVQRYLGLVLAGTAFSYYFRSTGPGIPEGAPAQEGVPPGGNPPG